MMLKYIQVHSTTINTTTTTTTTCTVAILHTPSIPVVIRKGHYSTTLECHGITSTVVLRTGVGTMNGRMNFF